MSLQSVLAIIDKAIGDSTFRTLLLEKPDVATSDSELTKSERAMLVNLSSGPYTSTQRGLIDVKKMIEASIHYQAEEGHRPPEH